MLPCVQGERRWRSSASGISNERSDTARADFWCVHGNTARKERPSARVSRLQHSTISDRLAIFPPTECRSILHCVFSVHFGDGGPLGCNPSAVKLRYLVMWTSASLGRHFFREKYKDLRP